MLKRHCIPIALLLSLVFALSGTLSTLTVQGSAVHAAADVANSDYLAPTPSATAIPIIPVSTSTPGTDGAVVHEVQYGQTLVDIAQAYGLSLGDLLALNGLTEKSFIFPGDKLVIKAGVTATPTETPTITLTPTKRPTGTHRPPTLTPTPRPTVTITPTPTPTPRLRLPSVEISRKTLGLSIIVVCALGLVVVGVTSFRKN
ncbi:MAG TPA: LysM peptidoglycan-binding domain-containing protein [Anaerolineaceae bacterium]|nr:LysM peptidoglycan-binding domain-containing protein [Anaerolineaceae bacterium]